MHRHPAHALGEVQFYSLKQYNYDNKESNAAGLLCSCGQSQQEGQETQGAELEQWHVIGDSLSGLKRVQKWEAYVAENPKDEMGWRNLYEAKRCFAFYDHPQFDNKSRKEFIKRVKSAADATFFK